MDKTRRLISLGLTGTLAAPGHVFAQAAQPAYPARPVKIIVAFGPGSGSDTLGRAVADQLSRQMPFPFTIENREGAGGNIGHTAGAKAPNDGYTLLLGTTLMNMAVHAVNPAPFDPVADFDVVGEMAQVPVNIVTSGNGPHKTWADVVAYGRANPGKVNFTTTGKGSSSHLYGANLAREFGFTASDVPYKSMSQAIIDTAEGRNDFFPINLPPARALLDTGGLRMIAVGSHRRQPAFPDAPTVAELTGKPGFNQILWYGIVAPVRTPPAIIARLRVELANAMKDPATRARIEKAGFDIVQSDPADLAARIKSESATYLKIMKDLGIAA